jgi:hypothetical protein
MISWGLTWTLVSGFLQRLGKQSNTWIAYFAGVDFLDFRFILLVLIQG